MSTKTGTVLVFLRSFDAVFVMDVSRLTFIATHMKNNITLIFLSTFVTKQAVIRGTEARAG
jgi:esterase/lipase superfamily enzyme